MCTRARIALCLPLASAWAVSCSDDNSRTVTDVVVVNGANAADFRSLSSYLNDPAVQALFLAMPRHSGAAPPVVEGSFTATGSLVTASSVPGVLPGDLVDTQFCFGPPAGAALEVAVIDPTIQSAGAFSFIEGTGGLFTVYTAFKSVQTGPQGGTCEIHQIVVFSGRREADGSLTSLSIGFAIVGLVGDCGDLAIDQLQVSQSGSVPRSGASCVGDLTPNNPNQVLVVVDNFLVTDLDLFVGGIFAGTVPLLSSLAFETAPGFTLSFESVPPLNDGGDPMGEILAGLFPADTQPAGRFSSYAVGNQVGDDIFFAPLIANLTAGPVTARVNVGTSVALSCDCALDPSPLAQHSLGYHFYDAPGVIAASQTNVLIDDEIPASGAAEFSFFGPFTLGLDSGALSLIVPIP